MLSWFWGTRSAGIPGMAGFVAEDFDPAGQFLEPYSHYNTHLCSCTGLTAVYFI